MSRLAVAAPSSPGAAQRELSPRFDKFAEFYLTAYLIRTYDLTHAILLNCPAGLRDGSGRLEVTVALPTATSPPGDLRQRRSTTVPQGWGEQPDGRSHGGPQAAPRGPRPGSVL